MSLRRTLRARARVATSSSLAAPSTGCAARQTSRRPSRTATSRLLRDRGRAYTSKRTASPFTVSLIFVGCLLALAVPTRMTVGKKEPPMRSVILSGFMATGKSTVGARLSARVGMPFIDTDDVLAREAGCTVGELWSRIGESEFRAREVALVAQLLRDETPRIIAFGGGTVTSRVARHLALDRALLVTLTAPPETCIARVKDVTGRPNLNVGGDPTARARELLAQRQEAYAESHLTLATETLEPEAQVDAIVALLARDPLVVPLGSRSYTIDVACDAPALVTDAIARVAPSSLIVVTDANVQRARGAAFEAALHGLAIPKTRVPLAAGEQHKTIASVSTIWDAALGAGLDRDALVIAFGGGVIGDLAGFAASALLRGVRLLQVPTTLLAMVDASVGGKTGFDHPAGKNLVGTFYQPSGVVVDVAHLSTLPVRERIAAAAEIVKIALVADAFLLEALEGSAELLKSGAPSSLLSIVRRAIVGKIRIVRDDEREHGRRALLNLGHTVGHALEAHGGYRRYLHGEGVALGMMAELQATTALGLTPPGIVERVRSLLARLGLPVEVSRAELAASWPFVNADKKRAGSSLRLPVVTSAGEATLRTIPLAELQSAVLGA